MPSYKRTYEKSPMPIANKCGDNCGRFPNHIIGENMERIKFIYYPPDLDDYTKEELNDTFQASGYRFIDHVEILHVSNVVPLTGSKDGGDGFTLTGELLTTANKIEWVDKSDPENVVIIDEPGFTIDNDTQITVSNAVAKPAGTYILRVTNTDNDFVETAEITIT